MSVRRPSVLNAEATLTDIHRNLTALALVILLSDAAKAFLVAHVVLSIDITDPPRHAPEPHRYKHR